MVKKILSLCILLLIIVGSSGKYLQAEDKNKKFGQKDVETPGTTEEELIHAIEKATKK